MLTTGWEPSGSRWGRQRDRPAPMGKWKNGGWAGAAPTAGQGPSQGQGPLSVSSGPGVAQSGRYIPGVSPWQDRPRGVGFMPRNAGTFSDGMVSQQRSEGLLGAAEGDANFLSGVGRSEWDTYRQTFAPMERQAVGIAQQGSQAAVDEAGLDASLAYGKSYDIMARDLGRMGINPNSGRFAGLAQKWALARSAAQAGAMTRARRTSRLDDFNRIMSLINVGVGHRSAATSAASDASGIRRGLAGDWGDIASAQAEGGAFSRYADILGE